MATPDPNPAAAPIAPRPPRGLAALAGIAAAAVALGLGELIAGLVPGAPSPTVEVGDTVIELSPPGSKEVVVSLFGTNDKLALLVLISVAVLAAGAAIGILGRSWPRAANVAIAGIVGVGFLAGVRDPATSLLLAIASAGLQLWAGVAVLSWLLRAAKRAAAPAVTVASNGPEPAVGRAGDAGPDRRGFLLRAGGLVALAAMGGGVGRYLIERRADAVTETGATIPEAAEPVASPPPDASFAVAGISPLIVPNDKFYRIDTALITPAVDASTWQLRVHGMVDREVTLSFAQLVELPLIERYVTIACVSNEVGGNLVGNAKWTGPRLMDVLDMAGIQPGATQIVPRSVDGWTAGFPTSWITDNPRDALIAVKMNDEPLPAAHGYPARLIVPGLYGYVSATKWLSDIELTTLEAFDAYWVPRGWAKEAPILTQSRIDVPHAMATLDAGPVVVAGVAWAPDRGIEGVEVSVDEGPWQAATIATALSSATWVQWRWTWQATPGDHVIAVRATDGTGEVQTAEITRPDPDGARGHHKVPVRVV